MKLPSRAATFVRREVVVAGTRTIYQVYEPPAIDRGAVLPVVLFLHGAGESGSDGIAPATVGLGPALRRSSIPALAVFPQASVGYGWRGFNLQAAIAALDDVEQNYRVDPARVYVTGISMGGYGTWRIALEQPARFAALVPVCGGLDVRGASLATHADAARILASIPQWVFHGDADDIIPVEESRRMVEALQREGANVRYTEYRGVRHNSWDRAYAEPELFAWLLQQRRGAAV